MLKPHSEGFSLSKLQIAIALGAVAGISATGYAYWYFKNASSASSGSSSSSTRRSPAVAKQSSSANGTVSKPSATVENDTKPSSPLQVVLELKGKGNDRFKKADYTGAIEMYDSAIQHCPQECKTELATCYQNRAAAYENLKKWTAVVTDCTHAIDLNPKYEKALMRRARAEEMLEDWEACLDDVTSVCLLQRFQNHEALTLADRALQKLGKKHAAEALKNRKYIMPSKNFIKTYFSSFCEDIAYKALVEVVDIEDKSELTGFLNARLHYASGDFDKIISDCTDEISQTKPYSAFYYEAYSIRASFYFLCGRFMDALTDLSTIIDDEDVPNLIKVNSLIKRGSIYMQIEKQSECLLDFEEAGEVGANVSDVFHHRGQVKLLLDRPQEAVEDFKKAVDLAPNFSLAFVQKCYSDYRFAVQNQDFAMLSETMENFKNGIKQFPKCVETYTLYAQVLTEREQYDEAEHLYEKALSIDPECASIYVHLGLLYLQSKGDTDKAIDLMLKALKVDEKCEFAYETLGTVEVHRGHLVSAIDYFNQSINYARSEMELAHLFSLRDSAVTQLRVTSRLGIDLNMLQKMAI